MVETADPDRLGRICGELGTLLAAEEPEPYRAFVSWLYNFFSKPLPEGLMEQRDPKEAPTMLATNLKKWEQELLQKGLQQGGYSRGFCRDCKKACIREWSRGYSRIFTRDKSRRPYQPPES